MGPPKSSQPTVAAVPGSSETPAAEASDGSSFFSVVSTANTKAGDAGNKSLQHYNEKLPAYRARLRTWCLPLVRKETDVLAAMQARIRTPWWDFYFAWSANLASHTFYVLMLPAANWFGSPQLGRDLVYVLGLGIYFTGNLKDFLCLPRPRSPPMHRITMSSYTTQEYGFPASHAANATAVTLTILAHFWTIKHNFSPLVVALVLTFTIVYYVSLIFGRLYCGMHGFCDIIAGSLIGAALFLFRKYLGAAWDAYFVYDNFSPTYVIVFYLLLIHLHFEPVDDCPCFDDSVAFIGVLIGLDISHWWAYKTQFFAKIAHAPLASVLVVEYDFARMGVLVSVLRVLCGVAVVVLWKEISKPVIFTILPPIYKFVGVYLPRRNYQSTAFSSQSNKQIRKLSISNLDENIGNFNSFIKGVTDHAKKDAVGPETDIDYYAMLDAHKSGIEPVRVSGVFKPRYDVEIIGRLIVYAGVSTMSVWGFALTTYYLGLG